MHDNNAVYINFYQVLNTVENLAVDSVFTVCPYGAMGCTVATEEEGRGQGGWMERVLTSV